MSTFKLGKLDPVESPLQFTGKYFVDGVIPTPPPATHYGHAVSVAWQMDGNGPDPDVTIAPADWSGCGDCVEAFKAHALLNANYYLGMPHVDDVKPAVPNAVVEQYCWYQHCTPDQLFNDPNDFDNGENMTQSLLGWCKITEYGVKAAFTAQVQQSDMSEELVKQMIWLGGGAGLGIQVQEAQEEQFQSGTWSWVPGSPIMGGHAIWCTGYDADYVYLVSWGQLIRATWNFIYEAADEGHMLVLPQSVKYGKSPSGLLIPKWEADLNELAA